MLKMTILVVLELVVGLAMAALLLAVTIPVLIRNQVISPGDLTGSVVIGAVLVAGIGVALFRPGSALFRRK